jgi:hypothetical protein
MSTLAFPARPPRPFTLPPKVSLSASTPRLIPTSALAVHNAAAEVVTAPLVRQHNAIGAQSPLPDAVLSGPRNFGFGSSSDEWNPLNPCPLGIRIRLLVE